MNIIQVTFEEKFNFCIQGEIIQVVAFKMPEHGNIKFGVNAPKSVKVHREEIYQAIKLKEKQHEMCLDEV